MGICSAILWGGRIVLRILIVFGPGVSSSLDPICDDMILMWAVMGYSSDGLPHVGRVPGYDNQYILAGFTGHGMPQIFLAAEGIAKMVVNGLSFEDTGLPRLFKTTSTRVENGRSNILEKTPQAAESAKL